MKKKLLVGAVSFVVAAGLGFFGVQFFTKTGIFFKPGELVFADEILDSEAEIYRGQFEEIELKKDLFFSIFFGDSLRASINPENEEFARYFLTDILVPTTDFYDPKDSISAEEFERLFEANDPNVVSILDLDSSKKLLAVDGVYYLDSFETGAKFSYLKVEGKNLEDLAIVEEKIGELFPTFPTKETTLTFVQTGVTALSRNMNSKIEQVGAGGYFSQNIGTFLSQFDLTHTSNESSFTDLAYSGNICSNWGFVDTLVGIGLDIVELTGNHNIDCGFQAALDTLDKYDELGIKHVGGGRDSDDAALPLNISEKSNNITFLAFNESTGGSTYGWNPGANQYYEETAAAQIAEAKARGDTVIVDIQYYECNAYASTYEDPTCDAADSAAGDQIGFFRSLIDMGADVVVGTSAHQTQTYEHYKDGEIYYGLGNLFFDQVWWPGTTRSLGLVHYFWNNKLVQTKRFGTVYDETYQTRVMSAEELEWFINRLNASRP
ncbi:CapA family protein [Candidatus Saccharibacteria bacterium]|nr:CapA family protein [Candidatus Saccharibacteria bacterium]